MSEAEQNETSQRTEDEWVELESELAEIRKKRDQLDAQNLRVTDNLRKAIEERDKAVSQLESLRVEYLAAKEAANTNSDNAAALIEQLAEMTASRNNFERLCKEWRIEFNAINAKKDSLQVQLSQWQVEHDTVNEQLAEMTAQRDAAWDKVWIVINERDAAERERTESRAEVVQLQAERDAAREQLARCKEEVDMFQAENTSLRDTVQQLRAKQVHADLPGILMVIQAAAQSARELI